MNRQHLRWCDYDNEGNILPMGYKRLKDGTIVNTEWDSDKSKEEENETSC